jgi:hypothetical protein
MNLLLNSDHDLELTPTQNLQFTTDFGELVAQTLATRLKFWQGEWWLDTALGVPYLEFVLIKNPDLATIKTIVTSVILETTGVSELLTYSADFNVSTRTYTANFEVLLTTGETQTIEVSL